MVDTKYTLQPSKRHKKWWTATHEPASDRVQAAQTRTGQKTEGLSRVKRETGLPSFETSLCARVEHDLTMARERRSPPLPRVFC